MLKKVIKKAISWSKLIVLRVASSGRFPAKLYYLAFSRAFDSELLAVACGQYSYHCEMVTAAGNQYFLRRSLHRLEKGLMQRPFRPTFATSYIESVVASYKSLLDQDPAQQDRELVSWARSTLVEYFAKAGVDPAIEAAQRAFLSVSPDTSSDEGSRHPVPYMRRDCVHGGVSYEQLYVLANQRRSIRWYLDQPVPRPLVDKAVELAKLSPSACNRQPFEVRIIEDRGRIQRILSLAGGCGGFEKDVPMLGVVIGHLRAFFSERDRHLIHLDSGLFIMSFCYALETLGLSSCCVNFAEESHREKAIRQEIRFGKDEKVSLLVAIGYADPDGMVAVSRKKGLKEILKY